MTPKDPEYSFKGLHGILPQQGKVAWIGLRPGPKQPLLAVPEVQGIPGSGLVGDRFNSQNTKREVTLIQGEHLDAVAAFLGLEALDPALVRRNIVVRGINLLSLKDKEFRVGEMILAFTGLCHPCSRMETNLGPGGYNAMRGHGGITARIVQGGKVAIGSLVFWTA